MSEAPAKGSPQELIENGFAMISVGLRRLEKAGEAEEAQHELATLVGLFLEDKMRLMKITGKII